MFNKKNIALLLLASLSLSAFAKPLAQRHCTPDDLSLAQNSYAETKCAWAPNDDYDMQVTLHAKPEVQLIHGTCLFTPANPGNNADAVYSVVGHKAAIVENVNINKNVITFDVRNEHSNANMNVLFYLNKWDNAYKAGDKIHCIFTTN